MKSLVFFLEEYSAKVMLEGLLPRLLPAGWEKQFVVFEGKQDLEKQLFGKLRAWERPDCEFLVFRDKDLGDCVEIRDRLVEECNKAGKPKTVVRLAIHELESWYLGDLAAVEAGLKLNHLARKQAKKKFKEPDRIVKPAYELRRLTQNKYQKVSGSRAIGPHLSLKDNLSQSFDKFISGIRKVVNN